MNNQAGITAFDIQRCVQRDLLKRKAVVIPNCYWAGHEADLLAFTTRGLVIDVEVKLTRADFKADAKKDKWWHTWYRAAPEQRRPREWPPRVWRHYFVMPAEIWDPKLEACAASPASGIVTIALAPSGIPKYRVERRCRPNPQARPVDTRDWLELARLANLRMWDALAALDLGLRTP